MFKLIGIAVLSASFAGVCSAHDFDRVEHGGGFFDRHDKGGSMMAPEIDPASAVSAFTMLVGGLTVLRSRGMKK